MPSSRLIIEPQFSLELRPAQRRAAEVIGQTAYSLFQIQGSTCLLLNPNETMRVPKSSEELLIVRLSPQLYRSGSNLLFSRASAQDEKLNAVLAAIHDELRESASGWREVIKSLVHQLVVYLLRAHMNLKRSEELELSRVGIVDRRLRRAIEFMHDHCARELSLAEIAAAAYLSEFHFARLFKKITGATPHAYLGALRIERARKLLAETDLAIIEVGARVGYNSQSHFTKIFREATGITPHAFRVAALSKDE